MLKIKRLTMSLVLLYNKKSVPLDNLSKTLTVGELRQLVREKLALAPDVKLFSNRGKAIKVRSHE